MLDVSESPDSEAFWFALYTRSHCERAVLQCLQNRSLPSLLPEYANSHGQRRPLFPGYVFVRVPPPQRRLAVQIPFVVNMVHFSGQPAVIPDEQLCPYLLAERTGVPLTPWAFLKSGTKVRVNQGPLKGAEGIFARRRGTGRLVLNIELFSGAAAVEISADHVESVHMLRKMS